MTVSVTLRQDQSLPLTWAQVDGNFSMLAAAINATTPDGGPTSSRPLTPVLYQQYFDTTLGLPIVCKQVTPSVIWVNSAGESA